MARISTIDGLKRHGKMSRKSDEVHRVRNGVEQSYILHSSDKPASKAQKFHRANFGKINAIVNVILTDPVQEKEWREQMNAFISKRDTHDLDAMRIKTLRQFVFAVVREQLEAKPSVRRRKAQLPVVLPKDVRFQIKPFTKLTSTEVYEILKARCEVFLCEQHITYLDQDNIDYHSTHFMLRRKSAVVAYARLFKDTEKGTLRVGRMLSRERGQGFGRYLMMQIIEEAKRLNATKLSLHAQTPVVSFYEQFGFETIGEPFEEAGISHVNMVLELN